MEALKALDPLAYEWLVRNTHPNHWSRSGFRVYTQCDVLLNNLCESFNSAILQTRSKHLLGFLESVRTYLMTRLDCSRNWIKKQQGLLCLRIRKYLEGLKEKSADLIPGVLGGQNTELSTCWEKCLQLT